MRGGEAVDHHCQTCRRALLSHSRILHRAFTMTHRMKLYHLPPPEISGATTISGLTGIVGTFFIKVYLDLPAEFLAMLGFWVGLPWALKMGLGRLVDLIWKWKSLRPSDYFYPSAP